MNKVYRLIWSSAQRAWVVVGELSSAQGKGKTRALTSTVCRSGAVLGVLTAVMLSAPAEAWTVDAGIVRNGGTAASDNAITTNTAIGTGSQTTTDAAGQSTAIGNAAQATAQGATAVGSGAQATALNALASGYKAIAFGEGTIAVGPSASAGYSYTDASNQTYTALRSMAIGSKSSSIGSDTIAIGTNSIAGGRMTGGLANNAIAIGNGSRSTSTDSVAIGTNSSAYSGAGSVAIGANSQASGNSSTVFGNSAKALSVGGIAVGNASTAAGSTSLAMGVGATANSYKGTAIGAGATTGMGNSGVAIGTSATVGDINNGTAIGNAAKASGTNGVAMGSSAQANGTNSISIGTGNIVNGNNSAAIGDPSTINGTGSYSVGNNNTVNADDVFVLGSNVKVNAGLNGSVVLGNNSTVEAPVGTASATIDGSTYIFAGSTPTAAVSVGATGAERTITHVAAGRVNATSTDAINGSQLFAANSAINRLSDRSVKYDADANGVVNYNSISLGGSTYNSTTNTGGTKITNVADGSAPSDAVNFSQLTKTNTSINNIYNTGTKYFHANSTGTDSVASGTDAVAIGMGAVADTARSVALGDGAKTGVVVATADNTLLDTTYVFAGGAPVGTVSLGKAGEERTLTNLAAGRISADSTDGINGSQLFATNSAIESISTDVSDLDARSVKYDLNVDGSVNYNNITLGGDVYDNSTHTGGTKITNVADGTAPSDAVNFSQLTETNDTVNNIYKTGTKYFHANSTGTDSVATGTDAVAIGMGAVADTDRSVALGDGAKTDAAVATTGVKLLDKDYDFAGIAPVGTVSIGKAGEERTLTNLAAGRISADSTDGINGSQLFATNSAIESISTDVSDLDARSVKYDLNVDGSVNYNNITLGGDVYDNSTHTGGTKITNVADGTAPSDAVNFSQLTETNDTINNIYKTGTKYFHANSTGTDSVATGTDAVAIGMGAVADTDRSVALGDGAKTDAAVATTGVKLLDKDYDFAGIAPVGTVSIGKAGEERTLTNLAAGRISADSTDGINGSQLFATNSAIESISTDVSDLDARSVKYDVNTDGSVNYNNITLGGDVYDNSTHTGGTKITNVADGTAPSDAVNFSQLTETNDTVNNIYNSGTKYFHANSTGADSSATGKDSVAIGMGAVASHDNSIALGAGSVANGSTLNNAAYLVGGTATSEVNIGGRRITGVSAGAMDDDAVNVAQLKAVSNMASGTDERALKYNWVDKNGDGIVQPDEVDYSKATLSGDDGTVISNLAAGEVSATSTEAINGSQLYNVAGDTSVTYTTNNGSGVRYVRTNATGLPESDAFAKGKASTAVGYNATSTGESSVAIGQDSSASALSSIAIGKGAEADTERSVALGDGAKTKAATGTSSVVIQGNEYNFAGTAPVGTVSVGDAGDERTITNVAAGELSSTSTDAVNGSQLYATVVAINNIQTGISDLGDAAVKYERNGDGTTNYNKVVLGGGPTTITNLAAGTQDGDAVNYSQLKAVSEQVTNISNGTDGMFQVNNTSKLPKPSVTGKDAAAGGAGAVASGDNSLAMGTRARATGNNAVALGADSIADRDNTVSVGSAGAERQITNLAAGTQGTDAVNVNQLKSGISSANQYTDNKFNSLKNMVEDQGDKLSAGIAGAMAMSGLPQAYQPGASMVGMAGSTYQNQSAVALGVSMISDNGKWVTKLSGSTNSQGDLGGTVGIGYQW